MSFFAINLPMKNKIQSQGWRFNETNGFPYFNFKTM